MRVPLLIGLLLLTGCASGRDGPETQGGVAVNVFPEKYRAEILAYQRSYLNDPTGIRSAAVSQPVLRKVGSVERYVVCVRFNAKAPSGGYTGEREHLVIFLSGKLDQMGATREQCKDASYEPFPELERLVR
ncbi:MAG: hypothetical protein WDO17_03830 [Alphaproteobacteria bacterium]